MRRTATGVNVQQSMLRPVPARLRTTTEGRPESVPHVQQQLRLLAGKLPASGST